jgi:nanoRNase/pAp phosphatase (c-di-AMP/oligoRNAs hydrolase)
MDNSFSSILTSAKTVLVFLPDNPNFDEVAAGLSLFASLKGVKEATISCMAQMRVEHNRLLGVDKISQELGNKNLTIRFIN